MTSPVRGADKTEDEDARITVIEEKPSLKSRPRMKKRWPYVLFAVIVVVIIIGSLVSILMIPTVDVVGMQIKYSGTAPNRTFKTYATVQVINPNMASVTVLGVEGKFYVNGQYSGDFKREESVVIVAHGSTTFDVEVMVNNPIMVHWNSDNDVQVIGIVTIQGPVSSWDAPFDQTEKVHVP